MSRRWLWQTFDVLVIMQTLLLVRHSRCVYTVTDWL